MYRPSISAVLAASAFVVTAISFTVFAQTPISDEAKIRALIDLGTETWNAHDMEKWSTRFIDDADFINIRGVWWKGREEIRDRHAVLHKSMFRNSRLTVIDYKSKMLGPTVATAIVTVEMMGQETPGGTYRSDFNRYTAVLVKVKDDWRIASFHNVNLAEPPSKR
jgi:uncharacterized protein (TIGR02246 family)